MTLPVSASGHEELAHFNKQVVHPKQPIKVDESLQPLPKAETVVEKKIPLGSRGEWMAAAGISPGDYANVEYIVSHESGWRPDAVNPSSGSCGLVQALPCSKIPGDWKNPVDALKWANSYVKGRYGSWTDAVAWWRENRWY